MKVQYIPVRLCTCNYSGMKLIRMNNLVQIHTFNQYDQCTNNLQIPFNFVRSGFEFTVQNYINLPIYYSIINNIFKCFFLPFLIKHCT